MKLRLPQFYGWRIVGAGAAVQALQSMLFMQSYTLYVVVLQREFAWSATLFSIAFAMTRAESGMLGPLQGWMIDRFGPRAVMRVGFVVMGAGFMLFSTLQNEWQFLAFYFLIALGASLGGFLSITTSIVNWFDRYRSKALAGAQAGFAIGGFLTIVIAYALTHFGWRDTAFVSGVIVLVVGLPLSQIVVHRPEDIGQHVDGIEPVERVDEYGTAEADAAARVDFTAREAMRTRSFWLISMGHASALLVVGAVMVHVSPYLTEAHGYTLAQASFFGAAIPIGQLAGQIIGGYLGDRVNKRAMVAFAMAGHMAGFLLLAFAQSAVMIWGFVLLHGIAWGVRGPLMQSMRADYFGRTHFGTIMGFSSLIVMLGMVAGPIIAGVMRDVTGGYSPGFAVLAVLAGMGSVFFLFATPPGPPRRAEQVEASREPVEAARAAVPASAGGGGGDGS